MAQSLHTLENIYYVAGRDYILDGKQIHAGDVVENARELRNIESFVRSRHLIAVVDDHNDVPVYFQKDVKQADLVELKFGLKIKHPKKKHEPVAEEPEPAQEPEVDAEEPAEAEVDPEHQTAAQVLEEVGEDPELALLALNLEQEQDRPRSTLIAKLEKIIEKGTDNA